MWLVCFSHMDHANLLIFAEEIADMAQVIFFLFSAMAIVELIDSHKGFSIIVRYCRVRSLTLLLWSLLGISFFSFCRFR